MRRSFKTILSVGIAAAMCLCLSACGNSSKDVKENPTEPSQLKEQMTQDFKTKDGTYQITVDSDWKETDPYQNSESSLELEIGGGITILQIIKQSKQGLGYDLDGFSKEVVKYFTDNKELGNSAVESTEDTSCAGYKAIKNIIVTDEKTSGMKMITCHLSIETDSDYVQFIILSLDSNRDKVMEYTEQISNTLKAI
ncbi:MAG: hypothetical protein ACLSAO_01490 [Anaerovoracaceae bacterium]